jgi:hypothetical protein
MNKFLTLLGITVLLSSCDEGTKDCIGKLQFNDNTVYSVDAFNYIVIEDSTVYHYVAESRYCADDKYIRIKIKTIGK